MSKGARNREARTLQMFEKEKARPGVGTPEREVRKGMNLLEQVDFVAYLTNTHVYFNTVPGKKQHLDLHFKRIEGAKGEPPILRYIPVGEENAVDFELLAKCLGVDFELLAKCLGVDFELLVFAVYILIRQGYVICWEDDGRLYLTR